MFTVLYTHQKTKKNKTWQDGTLQRISKTKVQSYSLIAMFVNLFEHAGHRRQMSYSSKYLNLFDAIDGRILIQLENT